jgi:hypothetical protein
VKWAVGIMGRRNNDLTPGLQQVFAFSYNLFFNLKKIYIPLFLNYLCNILIPNVAEKNILILVEEKKII